MYLLRRYFKIFIFEIHSISWHEDKTRWLKEQRITLRWVTHLTSRHVTSIYYNINRVRHLSSLLVHLFYGNFSLLEKKFNDGFELSWAINVLGVYGERPQENVTFYEGFTLSSF